VSVFRWTAPLFKLASRRWSEDDFTTLAAYLRPYVAAGGVFADLGGGTGDLGAGIAQALGARVIIVDPTPQMLRRVDAHPLVSVRLAAAERLPFPDGYVDALLCCDALHHFRDQGSCATEIARAVRPGGGVLILDMEASTRRCRPCVLLERALGEPAAFRTAADTVEFLAGYGIVGTSTRQQGNSYLFVGSVSSSP